MTEVTVIQDRGRLFWAATCRVHGEKHNHDVLRSGGHISNTTVLMHPVTDDEADAPSNYLLRAALRHDAEFHGGEK